MNELYISLTIAEHYDIDKNYLKKKFGVLDCTQKFRQIYN